LKQPQLLFIPAGSAQFFRAEQPNRQHIREEVITMPVKILVIVLVAATAVLKEVTKK